MVNIIKKKNSMNVGVITLPFSPNYGWLMQAYALQRALEKLGHNAILISRKWNIEEANSSLFVKIMRPVYYNITCGGLYRFYNKNVKSTRVYRSDDDLKSVVNEYKLDAVIVGSDQVWRIEDTRGVGYNFFLDFASKSVVKLSYAASFGTDVWKGNGHDNQIIKNLLKDFRGVSVREESGIKMCKDNFDIDVQSCIDPTLLLKMDEYDLVLKNPNKYKGDNLLSTYILDSTDEKLDFINSVAKSKCLTVSHLYPLDCMSRFRVFKSMENWLLKLRNSEFVIVDSFHGMVFCILYQKDFIVITNKQRGNTRFTNLLNKLSLQDRIVYDINQIDLSILKPIDYEFVNNMLDLERLKSFSFLKSNLSLN